MSTREESFSKHPQIEQLNIRSFSRFRCSFGFFSGFQTNLQCILFFSLPSGGHHLRIGPSSYIEKIPLNDHRPAGQFKALRGIKTSISYRRFTLWVGSQRDILNKKGRGIHNEGRDTTNACFNRFLYLVVDCNWKIRSCSRIGRCPSTNVKIGRGRGEFDERNFPVDHLAFPLFHLYQILHYFFANTF